MAQESPKSFDITRSSPNSAASTGGSVGEATLKGLGSLIKLLPTGTVFLFQFLNPVLSNKGQCNLINKYLSGAFIGLCGLACFFSTFTDSYTGKDGKVYYGIVTCFGLWAPSDPDPSTEQLSKYRLKLRDLFHAGLSVLVFAVIVLLDSNTISCFYPSLTSDEKALIKVLPAAIGGLSSFIFMVFPYNRHGIGYHPMQKKS